MAWGDKRKNANTKEHGSAPAYQQAYHTKVYQRTVYQRTVYQTKSPTHEYHTRVTNTNTPQNDPQNDPRKPLTGNARRAGRCFDRRGRSRLARRARRLAGIGGHFPRRTTVAFTLVGFVLFASGAILARVHRSSLVLARTALVALRGFVGHIGFRAQRAGRARNAVRGILPGGAIFALRIGRCFRLRARQTRRAGRGRRPNGTGLHHVALDTRREARRSGDAERRRAVLARATGAVLARWASQTGGRRIGHPVQSGVLSRPPAIGTRDAGGVFGIAQCTLLAVFATGAHRALVVTMGGLVLPTGARFTGRATGMGGFATDPPRVGRRIVGTARRDPVACGASLAQNTPDFVLVRPLGAGLARFARDDVRITAVLPGVTFAAFVLIQKMSFVAVPDIFPIDQQARGTLAKVHRLAVQLNVATIGHRFLGPAPIGMGVRVPEAGVGWGIGALDLGARLTAHVPHISATIAGSKHRVATVGAAKVGAHGVGALGGVGPMEQAASKNNLNHFKHGHLCGENRVGWRSSTVVAADS